MPKVLYLSESQGWSGGAAQLLALAKGLRASGDWDVRLASPEDGEVAKRAIACGVPHIPFHPRQDYDLVSGLRLARMLEEQKIDVLHAHHPRAHAVGLAALYLSKRRPVFVVTRRVSFALSKNPFSRLKYRNPRIDSFIAVAENVREKLVEGGVDPNRVVTIKSGVDTELFSPRPRDEGLREELAIANGHAVIAKIGNYGEWKGQNIFLKAAARMLASGRQAVFLLAGRDTDSPLMRERVREAGLPEDAVRLLGFRTDIPRILSICDVSVNAATRGEGISGAIRESLAMKIPVAASDAGGNPELVKDGLTGRLFPAGSDAALADVLGQILDDQVAAKSQAVRGAELVRERFSVDCMVRATAEHYAKLLGTAKK